MVNYVFQIKPSQYARSLHARNTINANKQSINPGLFPVAFAHRHGYLGNMLPLRPGRASTHVSATTGSHMVQIKRDRLGTSGSEKLTRLVD